MSSKQNLDQVILVDQHDQEIGVMAKIKAHRHPAQLHRASSVLLHNAQGEWLLQQRSRHKIVAAHKWANTCCGNLRPGEDYKACAQRRLREELGVVGVELEKVDKFIYQVECEDGFSEHEIDTVFVGQYEGVVKPNPLEVQAISWISTQELLNELAAAQANYAPWTKLVFNCYAQFLPQNPS